MLRRVLVPALAAGLVWTAGPASSPAAARQDPARIVVLTIDGTSIEDWVAADAFASFGAVGLLASRTRTVTADPVLARVAAYTTFGSGAAAEVERGAAPTDAGDDVLAGALGEALKRRGLRAAAIGDASGEDIEDAPAGRAVMGADGSVATDPSAAPHGGRTWRLDAGAPAGRRTDYGAMREELERTLSWATLVVVDLGDAARADRIYGRDAAARAPWIARALDDASRFARDVGSMLAAPDTLIVASLVPPRARVATGVHLAAVAMSSGRGLPRSGTTRRDGVLSVTDLGPTILGRVGVAVPSEMQGRPARFSASAEPARAAADLDAAFVRARSARRPLTRAWLVIAAILSVAAFLTVAAGRGRSPGAERLPRSGRDLIVTGLVATAAAPAALLLAPSLPGDGVAEMGWWTLALAVGSALAVRISFGIGRGLAAIAILDVGLIVGDLVAGTPLAARSPLGFQVAGGGRFYGIDEGLLGVALAGSLLGAAAWVDGARRPTRVATYAALPLAAVALVAGAPSFGSKFGAPFTLVPAFGVFVVLAAGRRMDRAAAIGIATATALTSGILAAADALASPAARSHIGREITGGTPVLPLIARKLSSFAEITGTTVWLPITIVVAVPAVVLLVRRGSLLARGFWGLPGRRAALVGIAVGCVLAMVANDTGIIVVAPALVIGSTGFYAPLLAPEGGVGLRPAK